MKWTQSMREGLIALMVMVPLGAGLGALLGLYSNRFGLSSGLRVLIIVAFAVICGRVTLYVGRRLRAARDRRNPSA